MKPKTILLAGEGKNELGNRGNPPPYNTPSYPGVLETLLRKVAPEGWKVGGAILWKNARKYRAGGHRGAEYRTVLGLVQQAKERGFDALVFTRDRDGEKPEHDQREKDVESALAEAPDLFPGAPPVVGGLSVQRLESWVLALKGGKRTEAMKNAEVDRKLAEMGIPEKDTQAMVGATFHADRDAVPEDARSLRQWLDRAREVMAP